MCQSNTGNLKLTHRYTSNLFNKFKKDKRNYREVRFQLFTRRSKALTPDFDKQHMYIVIPRATTKRTIQNYSPQNTEDIKRIQENISKQLYTHKYGNLEEMGQFLESTQYNELNME